MAGISQGIVMARASGLKTLLRKQMGVGLDDKRTCKELAAHLGITDPMAKIAIEIVDDVLEVGLEGGKRA
jgi:hypothetical protein